MPTGGASHERIERLVRITPELVGELRLDRVLQRVADLGREVLSARYSAIGLLNPDNETLASFTTSGLGDAERARIGTLPIGHGVLGLVIREGQMVRLPDIQRHPASVGFPKHHPPMKSFLGVPIVGRQGVLGDLYLTEKVDAAEFSDEDVHLAQLLAAIIASAVENARLYERTAHLLEEVQQLHRSRERFFAMVNHELRNALAAVYGWSEMLVRRKDPETVPRGAFEILEAAEQAVALVNDLLDLNRLDEDRLKPILKVVDCCQLIQTAIIRITPSADEKRVTFGTPPRDVHLLCHTDAHRVEQILVNVLTNAIRHTPAGSQIELTAEAVDGRVEITVLDQGDGVAEDDVERIFDIYYTTANAAETGRVGYGVGLPLSRRLARVLGGDLIAVAQPGHGGRFALRLPAAGP